MAQEILDSIQTKHLQEQISSIQKMKEKICGEEIKVWQYDVMKLSAKLGEARQLMEIMLERGISSNEA